MAKLQKLESNVLSLVLTSNSICWLLVALFGKHSFNQKLNALGICFVEISLAALIYDFGGRVRRGFLHLLIVGTAISIALAILVQESGLLGLSFGFLYVWLVIFIFTFFATRIALIYLACIELMILMVFRLANAKMPAFAVLFLALIVAGTGTLSKLISSSVINYAQTDYLTGLINKRGLEELLIREISRAQRRGIGFGLGFIDLDDFKKFNDTNGHLRGDELLRELSSSWKTMLRATDYLARFGGDEFVVVLPGLGAKDAIEVLGRLLRVPGVTCSIGVSIYEEGDDANSIVDRADKALYDAKAAGGNCVKLNVPSKLGPLAELLAIG